MSKKNTDLEIYTENDFSARIAQQSPFRPTHTTILLLRKGEITLNYNLTQHTLKPNSVLLISTKFIYEFISYTPEIELRIVAMAPNFETLQAVRIKNLPAFSFFSASLQNHYHLKPADFGEAWTSAQLLHGLWNSSVHQLCRKEIIHHQFLSLIYLLADITSRYDQQQSTQLQRPEYITYKYIRLANLYARSERAIPFYASQMGITPKHLSETVKTFTGFTARDILQKALLNEAQVLLADPHNSISHIAQELNFNDPFVFSKFFKRLTGVSPTDYRQSVLQTVSST